MADTYRTLPIDPTSAAKLAEQNLRMAVIDNDDNTQFEPYVQAVARGFHGGQLTEEASTGFIAGINTRRNTGVWDDTTPEPTVPIATADGFPSQLTTPGGREVPAWAISVVTVAATHRRRGIANEMLQSELRTAIRLGIPMAMLTVSESTIYGRFGFAPAALAANLTIDTKRAKYKGPVPDGRVQYLPLEQARELVDDLYAVQRRARPGEIEVWPRRWDQIFELTEATKEIEKRPRAVRYIDADGVSQGFAVFKIKESEHSFTGATAELSYLMASTTDAYAALWRFLLELDLVSTITAHLQAVDEPVRWLVDDFRAVKVETSDHQWLRILDVKACLESRAYFAPLDVVIEVTDVLGHAAGTYRLEGGSVSIATGPADITLTVNDLSAIYLGGVSATTLAAANRIQEHTPGALAALDGAFRSPVTPRLSVWY